VPIIFTSLFKDRRVIVNLFVSMKVTFFAKLFVGLYMIAYIHKPQDGKIANIHHGIDGS